MLLIYTAEITKRIQYIFKLFFGQLLGIPYQLTQHTEYFASYQGPRLNYSEIFFEPPVVHIVPVSLLRQRGIHPQSIQVKWYNELPVFFPVTDPRSQLPFDPFAASFYLVSRYEEYLSEARDQYGRFEAMSSEAFRHGFLLKPLVNIWAYQIRDLLLSIFPDLKLKRRQFSIISTVDIDSAYAYKHKGLVRISGAVLQELMELNFSALKERIRVLTGRLSDPFDTYDLLRSLHTDYSITLIFFILMADYGKFDKNLPVDNPNFHQLIRSLGNFAEIGIHPSFRSAESFSRLTMEIERLSRILQREVTRSRQHYLRLFLPETYRNLILADIREDYTMGYASLPGFRAGICDPFNFYDLKEETETTLKIFPFQVMDGTLRDYMNLTPEEANSIIRQLIDEVRAVDGTFISLWHNESLSDEKRWKGWRKVYEDMIRYAVGA